MEDLVIYGAGAVGRVLEQIVFDCNADARAWNLVGYLDDDESIRGQEVAGLPVLGDIRWLETSRVRNIVIGFSQPRLKREKVALLDRTGSFVFPQIRHPSARVSRRVACGRGTIIYPNVCIDCDVRIGEFVTINKSVTLGHDSVYGSFVTIAPGVNLGGFLTVGEGCDFGINACTIQKLTIGSWSIVGAGAAVIRDVPDLAVVAGNPARVLRLQRQE